MLICKLRKKNQGITLIALVITIIVLLILAGVSIATLTGPNGVLSRATEAKEKTGKANFEEIVRLEILANVQEDGSINISQLKSNLKNNQNYTITENIPENSFTVTDGRYSLIVLSDGSIQMNDEEKPIEVNLSAKKSIWIGDSIMAGYKVDGGSTNNKGFPEYYKELTKATNTFNVSFGGCTISDNTPEREGNTDPVTLKGIIEFIQKNAESVNIKFDEIDFIVLDGGGNDCILYENLILDKSYRKEVGTATDTISDTVVNDFREVIQMIKNTFLKAKILFVNPIDYDEISFINYLFDYTDGNKYLEEQGKSWQTINEEFNLSCKNMDEFKQKYLELMCSADIKELKIQLEDRAMQLFSEIQKVSDEVGVKYLDLSSYIIANRQGENHDNTYKQSDYLHMSDEGYSSLTPHIINAIKDMLK